MCTCPTMASPQANGESLPQCLEHSHTHTHTPSPHPVLFLTFFPPIIPLLFPAFFPFLTSISPRCHTSRAEGLGCVPLLEPAGTGHARGSSCLSSQRPLSPTAAPGHRHPSPGRGDLPSLGGLETWGKPVPVLEEEPPFPHRNHLRAAALCLQPKPPSLSVSQACMHMHPYARHTALPTSTQVSRDDSN